MRVFLSYRRSDNDYLAAAIHDGLIASSSSLDVFYDIESIDLGVEFRQVIIDAVRSADVVVALIGPLWQPDRLGDPGDYVGLELLAAREAQKRIVPVLHGNAREPTVIELPTELAWIPHTNMFRFGGPRQLNDDIQRLF